MLDTLFYNFYLSSLITALLTLPFIKFLYQYGFQRQKEKQRQILRALHKNKIGVPTLGGILFILVPSITYLMFYKLSSTIICVLITTIIYFLMGLADDLKTISLKAHKLLGFSRRLLLIIQLSLGGVVGFMLYNLGFTQINFFGATLEIGVFYILYAAIIVTMCANAFNITDGIDGLSSGLYIISLITLIFFSTMLKLQDISIFMSLLLGSLIIYLYFNIYPARYMMGDTGSQPLGALFGLFLLLMKLDYLIPILGCVYFVEAGSSFIQIFSKKLFRKRIFAIAPLHFHLQLKRKWSEERICMRFWLVGLYFSLFSVFIWSIINH